MTLFKMENRRNFGFSAENPTGTKGGGTRAKDCEKLSPCIQIQPGETVTLCDTDGPGMVTHMWFTGYVGHSFILRIYWENNEQPSVVLQKSLKRCNVSSFCASVTRMQVEAYLPRPTRPRSWCSCERP